MPPSGWVVMPSRPGTWCSESFCLLPGRVWPPPPSTQVMKTARTASERLGALSRGLVSRQANEEPVSRREPTGISKAGGWQQHYVRVEQYMTTNLYTVHREDTVDLVTNMMDWENIRHVPVEDEKHQLVGLVS